jgi:hypothetical protein
MANFSRAEYENLLYGISEQFAEIASSTLRLYPNSKTTAFVRGSVYFKNGIELQVFEYLDVTDGEILDYSYTVFYNNDKIRWYDTQPHPEIESLKSTFPHHRHEPPDPSASSGQSIKQNRVPAPNISFHAPNLHTLIRDCIALGESLKESNK